MTKNGDEEEVVDSGSAASTSKVPVASMVTRRQRQVLEELEGEDEYVILNLTLLQNLMNVAYQHHTKHSENLKKDKKKTCQNPFLTLTKTNQRFISIDLKVKCQSCNFETASHKMYKIMKKKLGNLGDSNPSNDDKGTKANQGNRASTLNVALAAAITNSMIGPTQIRKILLEIGVNVGACSTLHNLCNEITNLNKNLAETSMNKALDELKQQKDEGKSTYITQDGTFNNRYRRGPCQAGTQILFSTVGSNKKFVELGSLNKLCPKGKRLEREGRGSCSEGHDGCTATVDEVAAIGQEGRLAREALISLKEKGYVPPVVGVDGDCEIKKVVDKFASENETNISISYDPNHMFKNLQKNLNENCSFVDDKTFDGKTKKIRQSMMNKLSIDLSNRCRAEIKLCSESTKDVEDGEKRLDAMEEKFSSRRQFKQAILECLQGQCGDKCRHASFSCEGLGAEESLKAMIGQHVTLSKENLKIARERIDSYFQRDRLAQVYRQIDTNMNEAVNRGFQRTLPKLTTYSRNFIGRASREVLHINEGVDVSAQMVNDAIGHSTCAQVKEKLKKEEEVRDYQKRYHKKKTTKKNRFQNLRRQYKKHDEAKLNPDRETCTYKKGVDLV